MSPNEIDVVNRRLINRLFVETGRAPMINELALALDLRSEEIVRSLRRLRDEHRLLLYPGTDDIWVAHPFSSISSNYWIESEGRGWWGNCGFCSLGIAAMLQGDVKIYANLGGEAKSIQISIANGTIKPIGCLLHVPLPIARWHDNVVYTCGNVHFFRSNNATKDWCMRHKVPHGETLPLAEAWNLANSWYGNYLHPEWRPMSNEQIRAVLLSCGLNDPFWHLA